MLKKRTILKARYVKNLEQDSGAVSWKEGWRPVAEEIIESQRWAGNWKCYTTSTYTYKHVDWKMPEKCDVKLQGTAAFKGRTDPGVLCTDADDPESNTYTKTDTNTNTISGTNSGSNSFKDKPRGGSGCMYYWCWWPRKETAFNLKPLVKESVAALDVRCNGKGEGEVSTGECRKCKLQIDVCLDPEKNGSVASASRLGQLKMFFLPKCIFYRGFLNTVFKILYLSNILLMPHKKELDGSASRHMPLKVYFQNWICQKCIFQQVWWWHRKKSSVAAIRLGKLKEFSFLFKNVFSTSLIVT